jgi:hypothetical protein
MCIRADNAHERIKRDIGTPTEGRSIGGNTHQPKEGERAERLMEVIDSSLNEESITLQEVSDEQYNTGQ